MQQAPCQKTTAWPRWGRLFSKNLQNQSTTVVPTYFCELNIRFLSHEDLRFDSGVSYTCINYNMFIHLHMIEESIYILKRKVLQGRILSFFAFEYCEELWLNKSTGFPGIVWTENIHLHTSSTPSQHMIKFPGLDWGMMICFAHFQVIPDKKYRLGARWMDSGGGKWWPIFFSPILMK